jgi:hypothetical protein
MNCVMLIPILGKTVYQLPWFEVLTAVVMQSTIFWGVMHVGWYKFTDISMECSQTENSAYMVGLLFNPEVRASTFLQNNHKLLNFYHTTQNHIREDGILNIFFHHCGLSVSLYMLYTECVYICKSSFHFWRSIYEIKTACINEICRI